MLLQTEQQDNGHLSKPCHDHGHKDLCDDFICEFDGQCRSGCCSQVLTKGYSRCAPPLVGDACPRALDPIYEILDAERELEIAREALGAMTKADVERGE